MRTRRIRGVRVVAAAALLIVAGCGDDEGSASQNPTPLVTAETSPSDTASAEPAVAESPSASAGAEQDQTVEIDLVGGKPAEKIGNVTLSEGDTLTLVVTSDEAYELHVHGLDVSIAVTAGETVTRTFTVDIAPGSYEVEVEETGFLLFNLKVK